MSFNKEQDGVQESGNGADDLASALSDSSDPGFITDEPKKQLSPGTLAIGGVLLACAGAMYFMYARNGPQAASASPAAASASTTINEFLANDEQNVERMRQMLHETEKAVQQFRSHPTRTQVPIDELRTNPFRQETTVVSDKAEETAAKKRREELIKAAQSLKLQTVIHGGRRKAAMINGTLYHEGQQVNQFVVEQINPGSVIVRADKARFELRMQK